MFPGNRNPASPHIDSHESRETRRRDRNRNNRVLLPSGCPEAGTAHELRNALVSREPRGVEEHLQPFMGHAGRKGMRHSGGVPEGGVLTLIESDFRAEATQILNGACPLGDYQSDGLTKSGNNPGHVA
jgi:hypothetical protein